MAAAAIPIATAVIGSVLSSALAPKAPKAPKISDTPVNAMPTEDSDLVQEARRRTLMAQTARGGRASTVLTDTDEKFGGN